MPRAVRSTYWHGIAGVRDFAPEGSNQERGVGEGASWGVNASSNGSYQAKHRGKAKPFGSRAYDGSILGIALDADAGAIFYSLGGDWNAPGFGLAFEGCDFRACGGVRPAVSGAANADYMIRFGSADSPLVATPPPGFRPLWEACKAAVFEGAKPPVAAAEAAAAEAAFALPDEMPVARPGCAPVAVCRGPSHGVVLTDGGGAYAWGTGSGVPAGASGSVARRIGGGENAPFFVAAAVGAAHTLLLTSDGAVFAAGATDRGQCGLPPAEPPAGMLRPVPLPRPVVAIAACDAYSAAVDAAGSAWAWGAVPGLGDHRVPVDVSALLLPGGVRFGRACASPGALAFVPRLEAMGAAAAGSAAAIVGPPGAAEGASGRAAALTLIAQRSESAGGATQLWSSSRAAGAAAASTLRVTEASPAAALAPLYFAAGGDELWLREVAAGPPLQDAATSWGTLSLHRRLLTACSSSAAATDPSDGLAAVRAVTLEATVGGAHQLRALVPPLLAILRDVAPTGVVARDSLATLLTCLAVDELTAAVGAGAQRGDALTALLHPLERVDLVTSQLVSLAGAAGGARRAAALVALCTAGPALCRWGSSSEEEEEEEEEKEEVNSSMHEACTAALAAALADAAFLASPALAPPGLTATLAAGLVRLCLVTAGPPAAALDVLEAAAAPAAGADAPAAEAAILAAARRTAAAVYLRRALPALARLLRRLPQFAGDAAAAAAAQPRVARALATFGLPAAASEDPSWAVDVAQRLLAALRAVTAGPSFSDAALSDALLGTLEALLESERRSREAVLLVGAHADDDVKDAGAAVAAAAVASAAPVAAGLPEPVWRRVTPEVFDRLPGRTVRYIADRAVPLVGLNAESGALGRREDARTAVVLRVDTSDSTARVRTAVPEQESWYGIGLLEFLDDAAPAAAAGVAAAPAAAGWRRLTQADFPGIVGRSVRLLQAGAFEHGDAESGPLGARAAAKTGLVTQSDTRDWSVKVEGRWWYWMPVSLSVACKATTLSLLSAP